ncbi:MAG: hypothetical protein FVQ80_01820 [Planctomycetes bacterium]|nr:hypothetical protein [Planctomycetota bacterium]
MKSKFVLTALVVCLFSLVLCLSGCNTVAHVTKLGDWSQPGITEAEGHRKQVRNIRLNQQNMMRDLDEVFHTNKPSKLTEMRAP